MGKCTVYVQSKWAFVGLLEQQTTQGFLLNRGKWHLAVWHKRKQEACLCYRGGEFFFFPPASNGRFCKAQKRNVQSQQRRHHCMKAYYTIFSPLVYSTAAIKAVWPLLHVQSNNHFHWTGRKVDLYRLGHYLCR